MSFVEVLSEAIGGLVFSIIALCKGWIDAHSAVETALECGGCAILIPAIAFILRMLIAAPAELVKELSESKKGEEINSKSVYPSIITILLMVCSLMVAGLFLSLKIKFGKIEESQSRTQALQNQIAAAKPLPDKIVSQITLTNNSQRDDQSLPEQLQSPIRFVTSNPTNEIENSDSAFEKEFEIENAKKEAEKHANDKTAQIQAQKNWDLAKPYYLYSLKSLYDALKREAAKRNDGVEFPQTYFSSIPELIEINNEKTNIMWIRLQNNTNFNFQISILPMDYAQRTIVQISTECGYFMTRPDSNEQIFLRVNADGYEKDSYFPYEQANDAIDRRMAVFMGGIIKCMNKNDTNSAK